MRVYANFAATAPVRPTVLQAVTDVLSQSFGNPSDPGREGRAARDRLEESRRTIASLLQAEPGEILFTSGATESCNLALRGTACSGLITSSIEHPAVLHAAQSQKRHGLAVTFLPVTADGIVRIQGWNTASFPKTALCSVMTANNELGTIQPVREIGALCRQHGVLFHTDATQAAGRIPLSVKEIGADLLSFSAHKMGGPKGIGVLYRRRGVPLSPLFLGGAQEQGFRPGTENVAGAVGMAVAMQEACRQMEEENRRLSAMGDRLCRSLLTIEGAAVHAWSAPRLPGFLSVRFSGVRSARLVPMLDRMGITVSAGAACSAGNPRPSHVLRAIGLSEAEALETLRISLGYTTTEEDLAFLCQTLPLAVARARALT